jgi:hypothetical protein
VAEAFLSSPILRKSTSPLRPAKKISAIRLTLDEHWWFELKGENLNTVIDLLGDDFALWLHGRIGLCRGEFTARDGKVIDYIQVIPAPEVALKRRPAATTRAKDNDKIPFS